MRLIDADSVEEYMRSRIDMQDLYLPIHFVDMVTDKMPTVDAVPVVRCRECRYCEKKDEYEHWCGGFGYPARIITLDDYCSRGERYDIVNARKE